MNSFLKNLLGLALIISLGGALYLGYLISKTYDRSSEPSNFRSFTVSGDGKAVGIPDIAGFSFDVITEGDTDLAALQSKNAEKMNKAIDFVTKEGIDKKDIKTSQYSIQPRYQNIVCDYSIKGGICPPPKIDGYTIQQSVSLKIRDFKKISDLLSGVVKNGANTVSNLQFAIDDSTALENTARTEAIKKAQEKAQSTAKAAGFTLGRLLEISESFSSPYNQPRVYMESKAMAADSSVTPSIEAGSQEVTIQINLKYEIN